MPRLGIDFSGYVEDELLPEGFYVLSVVSTEIRRTRGEDFKDFLVMEYEVIDGPCRQGRHVCDTFWLWGERTDVARRNFASLAQACGVNAKTLDDSDELIGFRFQCHVRKVTRNDRDFNAFGRYKSAPAVGIGTGATPAPVQTPVPVPPVQARQAATPQRPSEDEAPF